MVNAAIQHNCKSELNEVNLRATPARMALMSLLESTGASVDSRRLMSAILAGVARRLTSFNSLLQLCCIAAFTIMRSYHTCMILASGSILYYNAIILHLSSIHGS